MTGLGSFQSFAKSQNTELFTIIGNDPYFMGTDGVVDVNRCGFWSSYGGPPQM